MGRKVSGFTARISIPALDAAQTALQTVQAGRKVDDPRLAVLAGASAAYSAYQAATAAKQTIDGIDAAKDALSNGNWKDAAKNAGGVSASVNFGASHSTSSQRQTETLSHGSSLHAGGDLALIASGDADQSDLRVRGSTISADGNAILAAEHDIALDAGENHSEQHSRNHSSSGALGAGFSQSGIGPQVSGSQGQGQGKSNGAATNYTSSQISAGNSATLISGHDTTLSRCPGQRKPHRRPSRRFRTFNVIDDF